MEKMHAGIGPIKRLKGNAKTVKVYFFPVYGIFIAQDL